MAEVLEYARELGIDLGGVIFGQKKENLYEDEEEDETIISDQSAGNEEDAEQTETDDERIDSE